MHKITGIVLLILGLLLGPGYYVYTRFFSGDLIATQPLPVDAAGQRFEPVLLRLVPDMQPVGLVLRFTVSHGPTIQPTYTPRSDYRVRLLDGERAVLDHRFSLQSPEVESTPSRVFQHALPVLPVERPVSYRMELSAENEPQMQVHSADVQVRAHVREPDLKLVAAGVALAVIGFLVTML